MKRWGENKIQGLLNIVILSKGLMKLVVNKICDSLISIVRFFFGYIYSGIYIQGNQYCKRSNELPSPTPTKKNATIADCNVWN